MISVKSAQGFFQVGNPPEVSLTFKHFYCVVQMRDGGEMVGIDAKTYATFMVDTQPSQLFREGARRFPSNTMGEPIRLSPADVPVAGSGRTLPNPTTVYRSAVNFASRLKDVQHLRTVTTDDRLTQRSETGIPSSLTRA